jgi:hypothetical protein
MQDLAGIRLEDIPKRFPNWLVAADRMANELLGPKAWLMRKGSGDHWLEQPTFNDWCQDPRGVVLAETTPKQIAMADDAGCRLELLPRQRNDASGPWRSTTGERVACSGRRVELDACLRAEFHGRVSAGQYRAVLAALSPPSQTAGALLHLKWRLGLEGTWPEAL